jgi:hypothetical protein
LFADFIPTAFGVYADQRILLSFSLIILSELGLLSLSYQRQLMSALPETFPFLLLVFSFSLAALQYQFEAFYLVEPFIYVLCFLAFCITGYVIRTEGLVQNASQALMMVSTVACFFYAAMTIAVYLFAVTDDFSNFDHIIPWGFVICKHPLLEPHSYLGGTAVSVVSSDRTLQARTTSSGESVWYLPPQSGGEFSSCLPPAAPWLACSSGLFSCGPVLEESLCTGQSYS